jgi:intein/homing endonuclease
MSVVMRRSDHTKEEVVRLGRGIYERDIRGEVEPEHDGEFVAVDVESGVWELGDDGLSASKRVLARKPEATVCLLKVGHPTAYRIGAPLPTGTGR